MKRNVLGKGVTDQAFSSEVSPLIRVYFHLSLSDSKPSELPQTQSINFGLVLSSNSHLSGLCEFSLQLLLGEDNLQGLHTFHQHLFSSADSKGRLTSEDSLGFAGLGTDTRP